MTEPGRRAPGTRFCRVPGREHRIEATDGEIDRLVNDLYGLTDAEIALVDEAGNS